MNAYFESPGVLVLAFAAIPAAVYVIIRFRRVREQLFSVGQRGWQGSRVTEAIIIRTVFFAVSWMLVCTAAAGPRWGTRLEPVREQGAAVVFVLDVSRSMTAEDLPGNRLEFAVQYASRLAGELSGIPCALVVFKGTAQLLIPLTTDRRSLQDGFRAASPGMISAPGSVPAGAISTAVKAFPPSLAVSRYIVLLSDGEQTQGSLVEAASGLHAGGITLLAAGVGTVSGAEINAFAGSGNVKIHQSRLDSILLEDAVRAAGGESRYVLAANPGSAVEILERITSGMGGTKNTVYASRTVKRYPIFLAGAIMAFCAALVAGGVSWKRS